MPARQRKIPAKFADQLVAECEGFSAKQLAAAVKRSKAPKSGACGVGDPVE